MINLVIDKNIKNKSIVYAFYYLLKDYDELKINSAPIKDAVNIFYGESFKDQFGIHIDREFKVNPSVNYINYNGKRIICFNENVNQPYNKNTYGIVFNFDILFTSYYLLTCLEEYEIEKKDYLNRFVKEYSKRGDYVNIPFVNGNSEVIIKAIKEIYPNFKEIEKTFKIMLTHDVDNMTSRNKYIFLHNIKGIATDKLRPLGYKIKTVFKDILLNNYIQIPNYIDMELKRGAGSEFYFIEGDESGRYGKRYEMKKFKKEIELLKNTGKHVIGMHTNFSSYNSKEKICKEIKLIEENTGVNVKSCRNHYLRFEVPKTWQLQMECGIEFDTTLGYSNFNGFRAGICKAFIPYDHEKQDLITIYEIPLAFMDSVIMEKNIPLDEKWKELKNIIDTVKEYNGTVSIIFHHWVLSDDMYVDIYSKMLDYIKEIGGQFVTSKELKFEFEMDKENLERFFQWF